MQEKLYLLMELHVQSMPPTNYAVLQHSTWHMTHGLIEKMLLLNIKFYKLNEQFLQLTQCES